MYQFVGKTGCYNVTIIIQSWSHRQIFCSSLPGSCFPCPGWWLSTATHPPGEFQSYTITSLNIITVFINTSIVYLWHWPLLTFFDLLSQPEVKKNDDPAPSLKALISDPYIQICAGASSSNAVHERFVHDYHDHDVQERSRLPTWASPCLSRPSPCIWWTPWAGSLNQIDALLKKKGVI